MKVKAILNDLLIDVTPEMHKVRRKSLNASVSSLISGASLSVTSLGRNIESDTSEKHQIKRSMRLCSNHHLHDEITPIYSKLCLKIIGQQPNPIILIDWSDLDPRKDLFLLRAAVAVDGRSLTLYDEVHPLSTKEKPAVHRAFMNKLKSIVPVSCKPIIVTDAGFRVPWFKLIESLEWDYVGRVRNRTFCLNATDIDWHPVKTLYSQATTTAKSLGYYQMAQSNPFGCKMVIYRNKKKGRKDLTATGDRSRNSNRSLSYAEREREPWLLATSISVGRNMAKRVVKIYKSRMQIEESFRDLKTGLNFNQSSARKQKQIEVLLLIGTIAQYLLFLLGLTVKLLDKHRRYQANSVKDKSVLSYQFIGLRAVQDRHLTLDKNNIELAINRIQILIREWCFV